MGSSLLAGWLDRDVADAGSVLVVEPDAASAKALRKRHGVEVRDDAPSGWDADAVVLAVKPQVLDSVLPAYAGLAGRALFVSIAAGKDLRALAAGLGGEAAVVRAMPNTPAAVGRGASVAVAGERVDDAGRAAADRLLGAVGTVHWVDDEALLDAVTALSGSGPAYVFLLAEAMAEAGESAGLLPELARSLARETVIGAAALMDADGGEPARLREQVTSPGGTTEAALEVLRDGDGFARLMERAVRAATERSKALRGG